MTKRKNQFVNVRGQIIDTDSDECPPGFGIRTSMMLMDGLDDLQREIAGTSRRRFSDGIGRSHQPGHRFLNVMSSGGVLQDAAAVEARDEAFAELEKRSAAAWRTPMADALNEQGGAWEPTRTPDLVPFKPEPDVDGDGRKSAAYEAAVKRASNAWRSPAGPSSNPAATKAAAFNRGWAASYAPYQQGDAAPADLADAAYVELVKRAENAWRTP
jgi:hypothetical protein